MAATPGRNAKVYANGYDLTGYLNKASQTNQLEKLDDTRFGMAGKHYVVGLADAMFNGEGFFEYDGTPADPTTWRSHEILKAAFTKDGDWSYMPDGDALGAAALLVHGVDLDYEVESTLGGLATVKVQVASSAGDQTLGLSLHPLAAETVTGNGSDLDNGAVAGATANGGSAILHVTDLEGATPGATVKVQHSVDGLTWLDLITFAAQNAVGSQRLAVSGTVNRHVRAQHTLAGGTTSVSYHLAFARG